MTKKGRNKDRNKEPNIGSNKDRNKEPIKDSNIGPNEDGNVEPKKDPKETDPRKKKGINLEMMKYRSVQRWMDTTLTRNTGSKSTTNSYLYAIRIYSDIVQLDPDDIIKDRREDIKSEDPERLMKHEDWLNSFFRKQKKDLAHNTAKFYFSAVRSFYKSNGINLNVNTPKTIIENPSGASLTAVGWPFRRNGFDKLPADRVFVLCSFPSPKYCVTK